jgi:hypothetical protein
MTAVYSVEKSEHTKKMVSAEDAQILSEEIGSFVCATDPSKVMSDSDQQESWELLLAARTALIAHGDTPDAWATRTPVSTEVRVIIAMLIGPTFGFKPRKAFRRVLEAIRESGNLENFKACYPETGKVLVASAA